MAYQGLLEKLETCDDICVPSLVDEAVNTFIQSSDDDSNITRLLELIPYAIRKLEESKAINKGRALNESTDFPVWCGRRTLDPQVIQSYLVEYICSLSWKTSQAAPIVNALKDLKLSTEDLSLLTDKVFVCCGSSELQNIPALVYQLLLVSMQGKGDQALKGIAKLFEGMEKAWSAPGASKVPLLAVEGTVLLQINIVAKQKQDLGHNLIKSLKEDFSPLKPFLFGMLLSLARISRCEKQVFDYLQDAVLLYFSKLTGECDAPDDLVNEVVSRSHHWDITIQSFVQFGKSLIKSSSAITSKGLVAILADTSQERQKPRLRRVLLGVDILLKLFESHDAVRSDILKQCQQEILNNSSCSIFYTHLLARLCIQCRTAVMEYSTLVKECLDCFLIISPKVALYCFISILPLLLCKPDLKNYSVIVLRKAMFSRDYNHRYTALKCLMHLALADTLPDFVSTSQSHACFSQQSQSQRSSVGEICNDLLGFLRKGLKQQYSLRKVLYSGFTELAQLKPDLGVKAMEMLLPHFQEFYEQDQTLQPPLRLEKCSALLASNFRAVEPLDTLIFCVQNLIQVIDGEAKENLVSATQKNSVFILMMQDCDNLLRRMLLTNLEDFGIDKAMDLDVTSSSGQANLHNCYILLGCIEAMLDLMCLRMQEDGGAEQSNIRGLSSLFDMHERLSAILNGRPRGKKEKGGSLKQKDSSASEFFTELIERKCPQMGLDSLVYFLDVLCKGDFPSPSSNGADNLTMDTQSTGMKLARNTRFRVFVLQQCNAIFEKVMRGENHHAMVTLACGGVSQKKAIISNTLKLEGSMDWSKMGMPLFRTCETFVLAGCNVCTNALGSQRPKSNQDDFLSLACTSIYNLVSVANSNARFVEECSEFGSNIEMTYIEGLGTIDNVADLMPCMLFYVHLHQLLLKLVNAEFFKEAEIMANAISQLCSCYPKELGKAAFSLACAVCKDAKAKHAGFTKSALKLALSFASPDEGIEFCIDVTNEIFNYVEGIQENSQIKVKYGIIDERTINIISQTILQHCCELADEIAWNVSKRVGCDVEAAEKLRKIMDNLATFCELSLPMEKVTDLLMRGLGKVYKVLGNLAKCMTAQKQKQLDLSFIELCDQCAKDLTPQVYEFLLTLGEEKVLKKESRTIPELIYNIEETERKIILLSKGSGVNLMKNARKSQARDFQISLNKKVKVV